MPAMGRYVKKQMVIEAVQWFRHGDHPAVAPDKADESIGQIETSGGPLRVEPGDWIITGVGGEHYPCRPAVFEQLYEPADE